jgi:universal stress protein A
MVWQTRKEIAMSDYQTIVLAVDLTEESIQVAQRALDLAGEQSQIHLVHVIEPLSLAYGGDVPMDMSSVQEQIQEQAKSHLSEFANQLSVPHIRQA